MWWTKKLEGMKYFARSEDALTCPSLPYPGDWQADANYETYGAANESNKVAQHRQGVIVDKNSNDDIIFQGIDTKQVDSPVEYFFYADSAKGAGAATQWINFTFLGGAHASNQKVLLCTVTITSHESTLLCRNLLAFSPCIKTASVELRLQEGRGVVAEILHLTNRSATPAISHHISLLSFKNYIQSPKLGEKQILMFANELQLATY